MTNSMKYVKMVSFSLKSSTTTWEDQEMSVMLRFQLNQLKFTLIIRKSLIAEKIFPTLNLSCYSCMNSSSLKSLKMLFGVFWKVASNAFKKTYWKKVKFIPGNLKSDRNWALKPNLKLIPELKLKRTKANPKALKKDLTLK